MILARTPPCWARRQALLDRWSVRLTTGTMTRQRVSFHAGVETSNQMKRAGGCVCASPAGALNGSPAQRKIQNLLWPAAAAVPPEMGGTGPCAYKTVVSCSLEDFERYLPR